MFDSLIGNEPVKAALRRFIANARVPNALLFAGDEGVGKRQFAFELARAFVCTQPNQGESCGICPACRRSSKFVIPTSEKGEDYDQVFFSEHPDIGTVVPYKRNVRIGAIRNLEKESNFNPYEARSRFFIIDEADKLTDSASNALLKTLEEPPPTSHIFLITSRPDSLLPTIRSRCQILRFAPVVTHEIERHLIDEHSYITEEATLAARLARGSIGRAITINVEQFRSRRDKMLSVIRDVISTGDRAALLRVSEEINDARNMENFEEHIDTLESLIHDVWTLRVTNNPGRIVNTDLAEELSQLATDAGRSDLSGWLGRIESMREGFAVNINRKVASDALFVAMAGI